MHLNMDGITHSWDLTPGEAVKLQRKLADRVIQAPLNHVVEMVAGIDCSYVKAANLIVTCALLMDVRRLQVYEISRIVQDCSFPYVPGLLSFREAPAVIEAVRNLASQPDLVLCDGQGLAHPRGMGLAAHVGLWLGIPTIGVAKSRLCGEYRMPGERRGCNTRLMFQGRQVGRVLRTRNGVKPLFVSVGHLITLQESVRWTLKLTRGCRLPEPARKAHREVTLLRREVQ